LSPAHHQQLPAISSPLPSPQWLAFDRLHPHPDNPRLFDREEVIEGIAQSLRSSGFDPAHALIVRPLGDDWQIISGHHRRRASERAELDRIPCWVRELDDATAYMMLVTCNAQSGLTALEYGLHALRVTEKHSKLGKSINAYAAAIGRPRQSVEMEVYAAEVYRAVATRGASAPTDRPRHLAEIHAAPEWLWAALVAAMLPTEDHPKGWTVEQTKSAVAKIKDAPKKLEEWLSAETPTNLSQRRFAGQRHRRYDQACRGGARKDHQDGGAHRSIHHRARQRAA
jgi:ParB/RepB/Spo0J family partition protein